MREAGIKPSALVLWRTGEDLRVTLRVESYGAEMDLTVEPGVGFLAARHLRLEILLARWTPPPAETAHDEVEEHPSVPEVYQTVLDGLRWDTE